MSWGGNSQLLSEGVDVKLLVLKKAAIDALILLRVSPELGKKTPRRHP